MATITVLTKKQIETILAHYPVGRLLEFHPFDGGLANSSVKIVTVNGVFVLSVCDEKQPEEISRLCSFLQYLEQHDFPTTRVVVTGEGEPCISDNGKPLYLKRYIDGKVLRQLDAPEAFQVGATLARLHEIPPHSDLPDQFSYGLQCFDELRNEPAAAPFYQWLAGYQELLAEACPETLPRGFVHGDLFSDNMLFTDGRLAAILDFEEACRYYKIFDIGMALVGCCQLGGSFSLALGSSLLAGYQSVRSLEPIERRLLQIHAEYGAAATSFWRYRQYHIRNPDKQMKDHYRAMFDLAQQISKIHPDQFVAAIFG